MLGDWGIHAQSHRLTFTRPLASRCVPVATFFPDRDKYFRIYLIDLAGAGMHILEYTGDRVGVGKGGPGVSI
jgi:hypothetical protein